jgi:hypothetical protein
VEILKRLRKDLRRKRPQFFPNDWILHHDSAPVHKALTLKQFLAQKWITETEDAPYYPDLVSNDF